MSKSAKSSPIYGNKDNIDYIIIIMTLTFIECNQHLRSLRNSAAMARDPYSSERHCNIRIIIGYVRNLNQTSTQQTCLYERSILAYGLMS